MRFVGSHLLADAACWVREAGAESFDAVILDAPDPIGPAEALYGEALLRDVRRCLKPGGVLARHLCVPAYQPQVLADGAARLREVFGSCELYRAAVPTYVGGDLAYAVVRKDEQPCHEPRREVSRRYYNPSVHAAAFALPTWWNIPFTFSS